MRAVDNIVELVGTSSAMLIVETRATLLLNVFEQQSVHVNGDDDGCAWVSLLVLSIVAHRRSVMELGHFDQFFMYYHNS